MGLINWFDKKTSPKDIEHVVEAFCGIKDVLTDMQKCFMKYYDKMFMEDDEREFVNACFSLGWPSVGLQITPEAVEVIEKLFTFYTKFVCRQPMRGDNRGLLVFKDEFTRFEKYILPFSKNLKDEAYRILDSNIQMERYRLEDGRVCYKIGLFSCDKCKKNCNGTLVEKEKGKIPTSSHALVLWFQSFKDRNRIICCVCRGDKNRCELCQRLT